MEEQLLLDMKDSCVLKFFSSQTELSLNLKESINMLMIQSWNVMQMYEKTYSKTSFYQEEQPYSMVLEKECGMNFIN